MFRERILTTACLAIVATIMVGVLRPSSPDPSDDAKPRHTRFFIEKTRQPPIYDCVIVGDSRGLQGISPEDMSSYLPGVNSYNFCFHAGGLNREIFAHAEQLLAPSATEPMILLAPTSVAFVPAKIGNEQYREFRDKPRDQVWLYTWLPEVAIWFRPIRISSLAFGLTGKKPKKRLFQTFHATGWIESDQVPHDDYGDLGAYVDRFVGHACDRDQLQGFFRQTAEWTRQGIDVFGVLPPAYTPRVAIEDSMLGFERDAFIAAFKAAGGVMLSIEDDGYQTYDGSHLTGSSARLFSRRLGQAIASRRQD